MNAIEIMMDEHKYISRMLKIVREACYTAYKDGQVNFEDFEKIIYFIKNYADSHHHKKEEVLLFNKMVQHLGAVAEKTINYGMLVEHDMGRLYVKGVEEALEKFKEGNQEAILDIIANAISYTHLLERHIDKEDNVIYKFGERQLSEEIMNEVNEECIEFEKNNESTRDTNISILEELEKKYMKNR